MTRRSESRTSAPCPQSTPAEPAHSQVKLPANYRIPAHSHPTDEVVTALSGAFLLGTGDKLAAGGAKAFPAGSVIAVPAKMNHFVLTKQPAVIQVTAMGPLMFTYVNPADDPSKK
jgi:quercetin dioxygenase-like cupin family protein